MKTSIVRGDNAVTIDGQSYYVDCTDLPSYIHAITWEGDSGQIEFNADNAGVRHGNLKIIDFKPYEYLCDRWNLKREEALREKARLEQEAKLIREQDALSKAQQAAEVEAVRPTVKPAEKSRRKK